MNCNSIRQHVPGVTGHSRELHAIPGSYRLTYPKQNPKQNEFSEPNPSERDSRELQAIFGSYRPFSGVTDPGFGSDTIFAIWFGLLRIASGFASDCFGLLRIVSEVSSCVSDDSHWG